MGSRMFHAIVLAGAALAEACGSSHGEGHEGSGKSVSFGGSDGHERVPAVPAIPAVFETPDAAALKAETDALTDDDSLTPDANVASGDGDADGSSSDGTAAEASRANPWGSILVK